MTTCDLRRDFLGFFASLKKLLKSAYVSLVADGMQKKVDSGCLGGNARYTNNLIRLTCLILSSSISGFCIVLIAPQLFFWRRASPQLFWSSCLITPRAITLHPSMENVSAQSTTKLPQTVAALSAAGGSFALGTQWPRVQPNLKFSALGSLVGSFLGINFNLKFSTFSHLQVLH